VLTYYLKAHLTKQHLSADDFQLVTSLGDTLPENSFEIDAQNSISIKPGTYQIQRSIKLAKSQTLNLSAGTVLNFSPGARMIVQGSLNVRGTSDHPVIFQAEDKNLGWRGLVVHQEDEGQSTLQHTFFFGTAPDPGDRWQLTGGVTFIGGFVDLEDVKFVGAKTEDALNIVRAKFKIDNVRFSHTVSDALDVDFGSGELKKCSFSQIGGDAIDVSGTSASLDDLIIEGVRDKAISVGEKSLLTAKNIQIIEAGTGVACKDGSSCFIRDGAFLHIKHTPLMAYLKKREYDFPEMRAENIAGLNNQEEKCCLAQLGSSLWLNGTKVDHSKLDVESLYATGYMRK
jgi:hypothetical protein